MSDGIDKFVLQYTVELKDSISRLEKLNSTVKKVNKESGETKKQMLDFAQGVGSEIGKLIPGIDGMTSSVSSLGKSFSVAAAAVAVLGAGVASVIKLKKQYESQRAAGMQIGVSDIRMEEYQRKFTKQGGGYVNRQQAEEGVKAIMGKASSAYADPTRMGQDARLMRMIGIDVGALGEKPISANEMMTKLGAKLASIKEPQALAIGQQFGLSQDFTKTLRKMGSSVGAVTEMTADEISGRKKTGGELDKFNEAMARLNEEFTKANESIAKELVPALNTLADIIAKIMKLVPDGVEKVKAADKSFTEFFTGSKTDDRNIFERIKDYVTGKEGPTDSQKAQNEAVKTSIDTGRFVKGRLDPSKLGESLDGMMDSMDDNNQENKAAIDKFQLAINMFSGAVSSFANAVDERQAWAAWAGEIGRAAGLGDNVSTGQERAGTPPTGMERAGALPTGMALAGNSQFDAYFAEASKKYNVPEKLLKQITKVESNFDPNVTSSAGAVGLMQLMPDISKAYGISNPKDPRSNIMGGARLMAENLERSKGDVRRALIMYHGGLNEKAWGPLTMSYPDKVLNAGAMSSKGESKANINQLALQKNIAASLGVPVQQIQQGGISRGDVSWAINQKEAMVQNQIIDLQRQSQTVGLPKTEYDRIAREISEQQIGLETIRRYRGGMESKAREGERTITIGQMPVYVNVTESGSPTNKWEQVGQDIGKNVYDGLNAAQSGKKL